MGRCECANMQPPHSPWGNNGQTYTWWIGDTQRCFSTYIPSSANAKPTFLPSNANANRVELENASTPSNRTLTPPSRNENPLNPVNEKLATVLFLQCYCQDRLQGFTKDSMEAADRFGMAMAYLSTPGAAWSWNDTVVNDSHPRPCSAQVGGQDYTYVKDVLTFLESSLSTFDPARVYTYGFSQNGMG